MLAEIVPASIFLGKNILVKQSGLVFSLTYDAFLKRCEFQE